MLETLYSTGMRRSELLHLKMDDLDIERGTVFIRQGKGRKDRLIPIGEQGRRLGREVPRGGASWARGRS